LAEIKARPVIQGDSERPERKKSVLVRMTRRRPQPTPSTAAKYTAITA
jgi:hypothetical protein